jgi:fructose-bisphosphate aldolase class II
MVMVSATEMIRKAHEGHYAIGAFNTNNLEWTKCILTAAQQANAPVMIQSSEGAAKYMGGYKMVVDLVKDLHDSLGITVPVALHLDHGTYEGAKACIEAGFTSIMFDGSSLPLDENVEKTKELVAICKEKGISLEAEVGGIGGEEDGVTSAGECADPEECAAVNALGVTMLACGIGNIHGKYPANWAGLSFDTLAAVKEKVGDTPLVLHGGSGIPDDQIKKAISMGVAKVNVNTECQIVFAEATRKYIEEGKDKIGKGYDPRKLLAPGAQAIRDEVKDPVAVFGSAGKA